MRHLVCGLLAGWSCAASAVGLEFRELPVSQFAEAVFRQVLARDYVVSSSVAASSERVSISVRDVPPERVLELASAVLRLHGVSVTDRDGVLFLEGGSALNHSLPGTPSAMSLPGASTANDPTPAPDSRAASIGAPMGLLGAPRDVEVYVPRHQAAELLADVARFAGAEVVKGEKSLPVVMYAGTPEAMKKALAAMEKADRAPLSVNLRAAILEVTDSAEEQRSLSGVVSLFTGRLGISFGTNATSGNAITLKGTGIDAVLSAVDGDSRFRYLAEPSLKVIDGQQARLVVGSEVPVRGAVTLDNNGNAVQSVEYRTAGVQLTVSPRIYSDVVVATVGQEVSSFSTTTTSGIDSPTMLKRSASTVVDLRDGEVVVLAGLDETRETNTSSGLAWLPFSLSRSQVAGRSQILLLMEIARDAPALASRTGSVGSRPSGVAVPAGDGVAGASGHGL